MYDERDDRKFAFVMGFSSEAPEGYGLDLDLESPLPWCCPWLYAREEDWYTPGLPYEKMGMAYARQVYDELAALLHEEKGFDEGEG